MAKQVPVVYYVDLRSAGAIAGPQLFPQAGGEKVFREIGWSAAVQNVFTGDAHIHPLLIQLHSQGDVSVFVELRLGTVLELRPDFFGLAGLQLWIRLRQRAIQFVLVTTTLRRRKWRLRRLSWSQHECVFLRIESASAADVGHRHSPYSHRFEDSNRHHVFL